MQQGTDVLIVGAGIAGLMAAQEIRRAGRSVRLLDKGRGVGGRLATRRIEGATLDHGVQQFTTGHPRFAAAGLRGILASSITEWSPPTAPGSPEGAEGPWRGTPTMSAVARHLAVGLDVDLETTVTGLHRDGDCWVAIVPGRPSIRARSVILTPPLPQALALLQASGFDLGCDVRTRLERIQYDRCLAVLAVLDGPSGIPHPGGIAPESGPIAWLSDNQRKGVSAEPAVTLHATPEFSLEHWDRDRMETARILLTAAAGCLQARVRTFQVHGWRYSRPRNADPDPFARLGRQPGLLIAGDAFGEGCVEGAAHSGLAAARALLDGH